MNHFADDGIGDLDLDPEKLCVKQKECKAIEEAQVGVEAHEPNKEERSFREQ